MVKGPEPVVRISAPGYRMAPVPQQGVLPLDVPTKADDIGYIIEWVQRPTLTR